MPRIPPCPLPGVALRPAAALYFALGARHDQSETAGPAARWAAERLTEGDWRLITRRLAGARALGVASRGAAAFGVRVPAAQAESWRRGAMVADFRQTRLSAALGEALVTLGQAGIPSVLLKGAALASRVYPGGFLDRPMSDLDVLVTPDAAPVAYDALRRAGWNADPGPGRAAFYAAHHHLPPLSCPDSGALLELHRTALPPGHPFAWRDDPFWTGTETVQVAGVAALVPAVEELLLHAAVHFAWSHELRAVSWTAVRDIAVLAPEVDWDRAAALADERRAGTCLYWAARLARRLGHADVPAGALGEIRPPRSRATRVMLERHFVLDLAPPGPPVSTARLRRTCWMLALSPQASGHGAARPWAAGGARAVAAASGTAGAPERPAAGRGRRLFQRLLREVRRGPRWLAWGRAVIIGG